MNAEIERLKAAYGATEIVFTAPDGKVWCAVASGTPNAISLARGIFEALRLAGNFALVLTAWNPLGELVALHENQKCQSQLHVDLQEHDVDFHSVVCRDAGSAWSEDSVLILCEPNSATHGLVTRLAQKYQHNAIFALQNNTKEVVPVLLQGAQSTSTYSLIELNAATG